MRKKKRWPAYRPARLTVSQILNWADEYHERLGKWPHIHAGPIQGTLEENWSKVNAALSFGCRGLPGGTTLPRLLVEKRNARCSSYLPPLTKKQILIWADRHHKRTGKWPHAKLGLIPGTNGEKWSNIDAMLNQGGRGFPGGYSLAQLLAERRGVRNKSDLPRLTVKQILAWADKFHASNGRWPTSRSGQVKGALPGETWHTISRALQHGNRGVRGHHSLAALLHARRGKSLHVALPPLTKEQILEWVDAFHERTGNWPQRTSGKIARSGGLTWKIVNNCLSCGCRGLPRDGSLARLLAEHRNVTHHTERSRLSLNRIQGWARAYRKTHGRWPTKLVGDAPAAGENWQSIDNDLRFGRRGLPGGATLFQFFRERDSVARPSAFPRRLTLDQIESWVQAHRQRTGAWPTANSGPVKDYPPLTWREVERGLYFGSGQLPGRMNLRDIKLRLDNHSSLRRKPTLTEEQILEWADAHQRETGRWPTVNAGPVKEAPDENWLRIDNALVCGKRGLPGGSSLAKLLAAQRGKRNIKNLPRLSLDKILSWIDEHKLRTGKWPKKDSGVIQDSNGETWLAIDIALSRGTRGLRTSTTLFRLIEKHGGGSTRRPAM